MQDLPESTRAIIRANYADEQRHLAWIREALDRRIWEQEPAAHL